VLVTTGKIIVRPDYAHKRIVGIFMVAAGGLQVVAAAVLVVGVLSVRWITQQPGRELPDWVLSNLKYRDEKTRAYRIGIVAALLSMIFYQVAMAVALLQL
jgi:hypothetical protein